MLQLLVALAGCSAPAAPVAKVDQDAVARYRLAGYPPGAPAALAIVANRISGPVTEAPWSVGLTRPADHLFRPLIIYLPSLGEDEATSVEWVNVWARAGYAVMVVQALRDDANVWSTAEARSGDFARVARSRFADELMVERRGRLLGLLGQIRQRSQRNEAGLDGLDWDHLALAGADLGAYTVQSLLGNADDGVKPTDWPIRPRAYLLVSPYAPRRAARPAGMSKAARAPLLAISSSDDVDAYGVTTDVSLRHVAFDQLGDGAGEDDYYLELGSVSHRWLGGAPMMAPSADARPRAAAAAWSDSPPGGVPDRRDRSGAQREAMAPAPEDGDSPEERKVRAAALADTLSAQSRALTRAARSGVSFAAVTLAFLDANLRGSAAAHAWLDQDAGKWLQDGDRLKHR